MKKFLMLTLTLVFTIKGKAQLPEKAKVDLEVIWEKEFDEPMIDVIFEEAEVTTVKEAKQKGWRNLEGRKDDEKVILPRIKALITDKKIKFYDDKGKTKKELNIEYISLVYGLPNIKKSKNEKFIGIRTISKIEACEKGIESMDGKFTMLDNDGNLLWEIPKCFYDFIPSPDGQYVIERPDVECSDAPLIIHNKQGIVKEIQKLDVGFSIDFSEDGEYIALTLNDRKEKKSYLVLLDKNGNELWKNELETSASSVSISKNLIACTSMKHTNIKVINRNLFVFSLDGKLMLKKSIEKVGSYEIVFSNDNKLLLATNGSYIYLFDVEKNNLVGEYKTNIEEASGLDTAPNFDLILIACSGYGKKEDYLYLFNKRGENILTKKLGINELWREQFYPYNPHVKFSTKEQKIYIKTKCGIKILKYSYTYE